MFFVADFKGATACNATQGIVKASLSVCLTVRLSVCQMVDCDKTKETSAHILILDERPFILVFWQEEWLVESDPFYLKFWAKLTLLKQKRRFSIDIRS